MSTTVSHNLSTQKKKEMATKTPFFLSLLTINDESCNVHHVKKKKEKMFIMS